MRIAFLLTAAICMLATIESVAWEVEPSKNTDQVATQELIDRLVSDTRPARFMIMVGGFAAPRRDYGYDFSNQVVVWERRAKTIKILTETAKELITRGTDVAPLVNKAAKGIDPKTSTAIQLTLILAQVGSRESVPELIDLFDRSTKKEAGGFLGGSPQSTPMACTSALWELTGRQHSYSPKQWRAWWESVQGEFVPSHRRSQNMVMADQVQGLINELKEKGKQARERLVVMGPSALPRLMAALKTADKKQKLRLCWVIDELDAAHKLSAKLRQEYFVNRFSKLDSGGKNPSRLPINHRACLRQE
ncbi:MAG: hypothetical protein IH991_20495 [Planctomycetes bacterium]|nr:hypothetical protein [Planctomycetota bacterium]